MQEYKLDATNKILGRLASEIARLALGKDSPSFNPAKLSRNKIVVYNTDKIKVTGKKALQKLYRRHSGYLGNLKEESLRNVLARDSRLALRHAIMGMLPKNKLRSIIIKNIILEK